MTRPDLSVAWRQVLRDLSATAGPVGLVGLGSIGRRYARILREHGFEVFVFDTCADQLSSEVSASGLTRCESLGSLLSHRLSFCLVATPPHQHRAPAQAALEAGIPTLVEKPLAHTQDDADALVNLAERTGTPCYCVCNMRFHPGVMAIRENRARVGKLAFVRAQFGHRLSQMRPVGTDVFASSSQMGGGVVLDCIHEFDYLQALLGPLRFLKSTKASIGPDPIAAEDWARIELQTTEGIPVSLDLDFISRRKRRGCEIVGSDGSVHWSSLGRAPEEVSVVFSDDKIVETLFEKSGLPADDEYGVMLAAVIESFRSPSAVGMPVQTLQEAARSLSLCMQALKTGAVA